MFFKTEQRRGPVEQSIVTLMVVSSAIATLLLTSQQALGSPVRKHLSIRVSKAQPRDSSKLRSVSERKMVLPIQLLQCNALNGSQVVNLDTNYLDIRLKNMGCRIFYLPKKGKVFVLNKDRKVYWQGNPFDFKLDASNTIGSIIYPPKITFKRRTQNTLVDGIEASLYESLVDKSISRQSSGFIVEKVDHSSQTCSIMIHYLSGLDSNYAMLLARINRIPDFGGIPLEAKSSNEARDLFTRAHRSFKLKPDQFEIPSDFKSRKELAHVLYVDSSFIEELLRP